LAKSLNCYLSARFRFGFLPELPERCGPVLLIGGVKMETTKQITEWLLNSPKDENPNNRGNAVYRAFRPAERYIIDFAPDFSSEGWLQFDTDQDAPYFGQWVNPKKFMTLCYCEGDWQLVTCLDKEHYNVEIRSAIEFYGEGEICTFIDPETKTSTIYKQDRQEFIV
jgi:hypothetical protein